MKYELNKKYPKSELENISEWWLDNKQYDINEYEDYIEIALRNVEIYNIERIAELKDFLSKTDYIVIKLYEAFITDMEKYNSLKIEYADIIQQRESARQEINNLE